jgi:hypothetical protein
MVMKTFQLITCLINTHVICARTWPLWYASQLRATLSSSFDISSRSIPDAVHVKNLNYLEKKKIFEVLPPHISNLVPGIQFQ